MATHYDMSGSEDGQLESPNDERFSISGEDEHDGDSLNIKPPQANVPYSRDSAGTKRKEKIAKEKKHSKEKKHRNERSGRERERDSDREREVVRERDGRRNSDLEKHRRDERTEMERYHQRAGYERDESGGREMMVNNERRYQKHYDQRNSDGGGVGGVRNSGGGVAVGVGVVGGASYHHQHYHQHPQQLHMQRPRPDYYDRGQSYHHSAGAEYYGSRHPQYAGKHGHMDYGHADMNFEMHRERRKYNYESQKDPESIEQDLRSRLLSKRHKYVKSSDAEDQYEATASHLDSERNDHSHEERDRAAERAAKAERHRRRREKERAPVIELLDSPEVVVEEVRPRKKHKRRNKEIEAEFLSSVPTEKRKLSSDPELLARRAKILAAEREKQKRKEELVARRELKRAKKALSPSAVAASVTAGLNIVKRKKHHSGGVHRSKRKRAKKSTKKELSDVEMDDDEADNDADEESEMEVDSQSDSDSDSDSTDDAELEKHYKKSKASKKKAPTPEQSDDDDVPLPESPLSIGELSKSPKRHRKKKSKRNKNENVNEKDASQTPSEHSRSHSRSVSRSPSRTSRSRTHSASRSRSRSSERSGSRSHSVSRSLSSHSRSHSRSRSKSRSRSRSRSEERDMKARKTGIDMKDLASEIIKKRSPRDGVESPARDEKGVPLPNYYPGIQGCRSVEEFQCLNRIEEGTYGVVYRAKDKRTSEIVALKRLKMEKEKEGFPITSLREINTLLKGQHPNIVTVREIVVGSNMDKIFIVMDYVEHDLKSLMETMKTRKQFFLAGEVKCLTQQLLRAVGHLHDNWILHRDLKTSNLLLSHKGILKVGDFGLAREYGSPLKKYTSLVVTLWYRAPELLLCSPEYSTPIDIWSVGCIFAEFLQMAPMFPGKTEVEELHKIFKELGTPNEKIWPGYKELPAVKNMVSQNSQFTDYPISNLRKRFSEKSTELGIELLLGLLTYDPKQRLTAEKALNHAYFKELPLPIDPSMFPTWPAKSELGVRRALASSPKPPSGGSQFKQLGRDEVIVGGGGAGGAAATGTNAASNSKVMSGIITGNKKTAANTGFVLNSGIDQRQLAMGPGFNLKF